MLRKTSASIFLVVMSFLILLRAPVFGYCPEEESFFLGEFECRASHEHHGDDDHCDHGEEPVPSPCDGEHELFSYDSEEFLWSAMGDLEEEKIPLLEGVECAAQAVPGFPREFREVTLQSRPPPPDLPIFLRFSVLRL